MLKPTDNLIDKDKGEILGRNENEHRDGLEKRNDEGRAHEYRAKATLLSETD